VSDSWGSIVQDYAFKHNLEIPFEGWFGETPCEDEYGVWIEGCVYAYVEMIESNAFYEEDDFTFFWCDFLEAIGKGKLK